ncbi:MAG: hypothetical protein ACUVR7_07850 [Armatimonadota bacterium]
MSSFRAESPSFTPNRFNRIPAPYPWTIRGIGNNCALVDVLLVTPYQGIDFGTYPAGRHFIRNVGMEALYRGLYIDQCCDIGRVENLHIWPFWEVWQTPLKQFMEREAIAFIIGRTDWEYMSNCFCIGYKVGFQTKGAKPSIARLCQPNQRFSAERARRRASCR